MRDAITKNTQTTTHLKPPSTKVFPSRTRARSTRARYARARPTSLADTPARLRSQALPATNAAIDTSSLLTKSAGNYACSLALAGSTRDKRGLQANDRKPKTRSMQAPTRSQHYTLIGSRPAKARLHISYSLRRLSIGDLSSRLSLGFQSVSVINRAEC